MQPLPNEENIVSSNGERAADQLPDQNVASEFGKSYFISIFLKNISSVEVKYKSQIIYIILAVTGLLAGAY